MARRKPKKQDAHRPASVSLASHPRARAGIARGRALGGLIAFVAVALGVYASGHDLFQAAWQGLAAGAVGMLLGWRLAQSYWKIVLHLERQAAVRALQANAGDEDAAR